MATKPKRPCNKVGCRNLTTNTYCDEHAYILEQREKERQRRYDRNKRDKQASQFYKSVAWQVLRQQALIRDKGLCQGCLDNQQITTATEVDHTIPIKVRWDLRLRLDNLRCLCHRCHMKKTAEDKKKYNL